MNSKQQASVLSWSSKEGSAMNGQGKINRLSRLGTFSISFVFAFSCFALFFLSVLDQIQANSENELTKTHHYNPNVNNYHNEYSNVPRSSHHSRESVSHKRPPPEPNTQNHNYPYNHNYQTYAQASHKDNNNNKNRNDKKVSKPMYSYPIGPSEPASNKYHLPKLYEFISSVGLYDDNKNNSFSMAEALTLNGNQWTASHDHTLNHKNHNNHNQAVYSKVSDHFINPINFDEIPTSPGPNLHSLGSPSPSPSPSTQPPPPPPPPSTQSPSTQSPSTSSPSPTTEPPPPPSPQTDSPSTKPIPYVQIINNQLYVQGQKFWIQGICYSPVPIGESVNWPPFGDYFTPDYAWIWQRDLPLIKAMGATTIRIYGWKNEVDHTPFLDAVHAAGLKALITYYLGSATETPVYTEEQRNQVIANFVAQVDRYKNHPAILMWSFGNELNGAWNKFVSQFSDAFGCWWTPYCAGYSDTNSDCQWQSSCAYFHLYRWINAAAKAAKVVSDRPIISGMADVDYMVGTNGMLDKVYRFNYLIPDIDAWAIQLYRGFTFGGYFQMYRSESWKPMIVTEFGVDAYNDPCGWPENNQGNGCFNLPGDGYGGDVALPGKGFWGCSRWDLDCSKPGVQSQKEWDMRLAAELMGNYAHYGGVVLGGFLMAWTDEFWKGVGTQDFCWHPCSINDIWYCKTAGAAAYKPGGSAACTWKAHFTCSNWDTQFHDLCGYFLAATPDNYVNEEWFGITTPGPCWRNDINGGHRLNTLFVRPAYLGLMQLWTGNSEVDTSMTTCEALSPCWECSTSKTMDELLDGSCSDVCAIKPAASGPGSSLIHSSQARGGPNSVDLEPNDFWGRFGTPILAGAAALTVAIIASVCVVIRSWHHNKITN